MTDRPIIFSAPMIRALLDGRKTQTRRVLNPQPSGDGLYYDISAAKRALKVCKGDWLWVREACAIVGNVDPGFVLYRANGYEAECERHGFDKPLPRESDVRWRPSIHMPRWASRITLIVTDTRVQRLQEISEEDAIAEGIYWTEQFEGWTSGAGVDESCDYHGAKPALSYAKLWDRINGPGAWEANPWVAAYSFTVHKRNIDAMGET